MSEASDTRHEAARHRQLCETFERLQALSPVARAEALAALQLEDHGLYHEVQAMLAASERPGLAVPDPDARITDLASERGYRVLRELGRGGMGRVLLAERADGRFMRQVAIKILERSPDDPDWRRRFGIERDILARLVHPNIVRLLDAGESLQGVPYLVMEYVDGRPLDQYLRAHALNLAQRVALFEQIGAAVAYAHQMLVAHRDLKPSNVLIDVDGKAHLLDFGIARLLSEPQATATFAGALTPRYAAPEQVAGAPSTAAIDVYQLGLLLYELLAGASPFADLDGPALLRAALDTDPPAPSQAAETQDRAERLRIDADLDAICMRALRKEPTQRYPTVEALLADLGRWRRGEPVLAYAGGFAYRTRKLLRRRWREFSMAAILLALTAGFIWRLNQELLRSERERAVAEQATELIIDLFGRADPNRAQGQELTLREALDQSVERVRSATELPSLVRARVLESIGSTYIELSRQSQAIPILGEAADLFEQQGDLVGQTRALHGRAIAIQDMGRYAEAQSAIESIVSTRAKAGLFDASFEADLYSSLGNLHQYQRQPEAALAAYDRALAVVRGMAQPDQAQLAHLLRNLGEIRTSQGDAAGGQQALLEAQRIMHDLLGPDHPDSIRLLRALGRNAMRRQAVDEALDFFETGWERAQRVFDAPHTVRTLLAHPLAMAYLHRGDVAKAITIMRQAESEAAGLYPEGHPSRVTVATDLSLILLAADQFDDARTHAELGRAGRQALEETDAAIAQPELVLAVLDCLQSPSSAARNQVAATLIRVRADTQLSMTVIEDYAKAAARCH